MVAIHLVGMAWSARLTETAPDYRSTRLTFVVATRLYFVEVSKRDFTDQINWTGMSSWDLQIL